MYDISVARLIQSDDARRIKSPGKRANKIKSSSSDVQVGCVCYTTRQVRRSAVPERTRKILENLLNSSMPLVKLLGISSTLL